MGPRTQKPGSQLGGRTYKQPKTKHDEVSEIDAIRRAADLPFSWVDSHRLLRAVTLGRQSRSTLGGSVIVRLAGKRLILNHPPSSFTPPRGYSKFIPVKWTLGIVSEANRMAICSKIGCVRLKSAIECGFDFSKAWLSKAEYNPCGAQGREKSRGLGVFSTFCAHTSTMRITTIRFLL